MKEDKIVLKGTETQENKDAERERERERDMDRPFQPNTEAEIKGWVRR